MELPVQIVRFVTREPQPGVVACELVDAEKRIHTLIDKVYIFSTEELDEQSRYPLTGSVSCKLLAAFQDTHGHELLKIATIESTEGLSEFVLLQEQVLDH
jgi:hypothetical protein